MKNFLGKVVLVLFSFGAIIFSLAKSGIVRFDKVLKNVDLNQIRIGIENEVYNPIAWLIVAIIVALIAYCLFNIAKKLAKIAGIIGICLVFVAGVKFVNAYQSFSNIKSIESYTVKSQNTILYSTYQYDKLENEQVYNKLATYKYALKDKTIKSLEPNTIVENIGPKICVGKEYFGLHFIQYTMCHVKTLDGVEGYVFENQVTKKAYIVDDSDSAKSVVEIVNSETFEKHNEENPQLIYLLSAQEEDK